MTATLAHSYGLACEVNPRTLALLVGRIAKYLPARPNTPVMAGILLEVDVDGRLTASGFDYDTAAQARVDVDDATPGRALVSGRLLDALTKTLPDKPVDLAVDDIALTVRCGRIQLTLPLMVADDYPTLPVMPAAIGTVEAGTFATLINRVGVAADRTGGGGIPALHGIHLSLGSNIEAIGSDRYRAAIGHCPWQPVRTGEPININVPSPTLLDLAKTLTEAGRITIGHDPGSGVVGFATDNYAITSRLIAEPFPVEPSRQVIPRRGDTPAVVNTADLALAVRRAELVRSDKTAPVALTFTGGLLTVAGSGDANTGEDLDCTYAGPAVTVHVNPAYFADALAGLHSGTAEISITDPFKPIAITSPDDAEQAYRHAVVPIRPR